jgi:hypothetical protein
MKRTALICLFLLAAGAALRAGTIAARPGWEHDDVLVFTASAGRPIGEWRDLEGRWVEAARWQELVTPRPGVGLAEIARTVPRFGHVHPPLWYWTVHAWTLAFGVNLWSVPLLNLLLGLATGTVLYFFARERLGSGEAALLPVALWAFSPGAIGVTALDRPYELLTLLTIALASLVLPSPDRPGPPSAARLLGVAGLSAAGLLLHYQFVFVYAACAVALLAGGRGNLRRNLTVAGALLAGIVLHPFLFPGFRLVFAVAGRISRRAADRGPSFVERLTSPSQTGQLFFDQSFFAPQWREPWSLLLALAWLAVLGGLLWAAAAAWLRHRSRTSAGEGPALSPTAVAILFGATILASAQAAYVLGLIPPHATTSRYVANVWPFAALGVAALVRLLPRHREAAGFAVAALMLTSGVLQVQSSFVFGRRGLEGPGILAGAEAVVLDNPSTGVVPRVMALLEPSTPVFVAWRKRLIEEPDTWLGSPPAGARRVAVVSSQYHWDPNARDGEAGLVRFLEERMGPPESDGDLLRIGRVRRFDRAGAEAPAR